MGKQKQQRRSAKKKGGKKKGEAGGAGQNNCEGGESVKCTACAKLVKPEDTVPCPVPECDRVFCTDRCSASCLVQCADPLCLLPNRCRPCASGKTAILLVRRNVALQYGLPQIPITPITRIHYQYSTCDICPNKECGECNYFEACSKCHKEVCLECIDSDRCILNFCGGACNKVYCEQCDAGFDVYSKRCTECTVEAQFLADEDERPKLCLDKRKVMVDEVVLQYAEDIKLAMWDVAMLAERVGILTRSGAKFLQIAKDYRPSFTEAGYFSSEGGATTRETTKLVARIVRPSGEGSETTPQKVAAIVGRYVDKDQKARGDFEEKSLQMTKLLSACSDHHNRDSVSECSLDLYRLSMEMTNLCRGVVLALAPDAAAMLGAFQGMEEQVSSIATVLKLQGIHLDIMHDVYQRELCGHCLRPTPDGDSTKRCGGCSAIRYCNKTCQALSWPVHRYHCERTGVTRREHNERLLRKRSGAESERAIEEENQRVMAQLDQEIRLFKEEIRRNEARGIPRPRGHYPWYLNGDQMK